jgi:hypothetical protein
MGRDRPLLRGCERAQTETPAPANAGVAIMGSVASSTYAHRIANAVSPLPHGASDSARSSLGAR